MVHAKAPGRGRCRRPCCGAGTAGNDSASGWVPHGWLFAGPGGTGRQADLALLAATFLWGTSFVAVKSALADATPFAFIAVRFGIAALALAPGTRFRPAPDRAALRGGLLLGALVAVGFISQTTGLVITTPARSAFIVAVSSILAPVIALALLGQRPSWVTAAALALAMFCIYLLTAPDAGGLNRGDLLTLICAGCFGGQIVAGRGFAPPPRARPPGVLPNAT